MSPRKKPEIAPERSPRERMVIAAALLLSEKGLAGASFSEVIERSGAPRGSIYHHFPDGKDALASEAIAMVGDRAVALLQQRDLTAPHEVVARFVDGFRTILERSGFRAGCAIAAIANERQEHPALAKQAGDVLRSWERELEEALFATGLGKDRAHVAAPLILAAVEGAVIICRARKEIAPMNDVAKALESWVS